MEFSGAHRDQRAFSNNKTKDHTRFKKILLCLVIGRTEMGQGGREGGSTEDKEGSKEGGRTGWGQIEMTPLCTLTIGFGEFV